jgi:hypothetical protein
VAVHGVGAEGQSFGDLGVAEAVGHEPQHLELAGADVSRRAVARAVGQRRLGARYLTRGAQRGERVSGGACLRRCALCPAERGQRPRQFEPGQGGVVGRGDLREAVEGVLAGSARLVVGAIADGQLAGHEECSSLHVWRADLGGGALELGPGARCRLGLAELGACADQQLQRGQASERAGGGQAAKDALGRVGGGRRVAGVERERSQPEHREPMGAGPLEERARLLGAPLAGAKLAQSHQPSSGHARSGGLEVAHRARQLGLGRRPVPRDGQHAAVHAAADS